MLFITFIFIGLLLAISNKLCIQYGRAVINNTATFPLTFPNKCWSVVTTYTFKDAQPNAGATASINTGYISLGGFSAVNAHSPNANGAHYIAIGY